MLLKLWAACWEPPAIAIALGVTINAVTSKIIRLTNAGDAGVLLADLIRRQALDFGVNQVSLDQARALLAESGFRTALKRALTEEVDTEGNVKACKGAAKKTRATSERSPSSF